MAIITTETIKNKVVQDEILSEILTTARNIGNLDNPAVVKNIQIKGLSGSIAMMKNVNVFENVKELESSGFESAEFEKYTFDLKKDRIKIAISDEAQLSNCIGNVFELQKQDAAQALASSFDRQIGEALALQPQTLNELDLTNNNTNVFKTISEGITTLLPYKSTAMCMSHATFYQILSVIELRGNMCVQNADGTITIPGLPNLPVIISDNIPLNSAFKGRIFIVSNEVPAAIKVTGSIITRTYDEERNGAVIFQSDVFRCVKSNIRTIEKSGLNYNRGVVSIDVKW